VFRAAQSGLTPSGARAHLGLRAGVSGGPGQFVVGGHVETKPLLTHLTFGPNDVGVGAIDSPSVKFMVGYVFR
jgi:hypothetical protein